MSDKEFAARIKEVASDLELGTLTRNEFCILLRDTLVKSYETVDSGAEVLLKDIENMSQVEAVKFIRGKTSLSLRESLDYFNRLTNSQKWNVVR
jgi:hypothetical protein